MKNEKYISSGIKIPESIKNWTTKQILLAIVGSTIGLIGTIILFVQMF